MSLNELPKRVRDYISVEPNGCWIWKGYCVPDGYGRLSRTINNKIVTYWAHRYVYRLSKGEIPGGMDLDHRCHVRNCVNPDHLQPVSTVTNGKRKAPGFRKLTLVEITDKERSRLISLLEGQSDWESRSILRKLGRFDTDESSLISEIGIDQLSLL